MVHKLWRRLFTGDFARGVATLSAGTAFAQALAVMVLPILTRLYTPQDFDLLAVYMAAAGIITVVACLRYEIAIPLPDSDKDGMALLVISFMSVGCVSALVAVVVLTFPVETASLIGQPALAPYIFMVPAAVFSASIYSALQFWSSRRRRFALISKTRVNQAASGAGTQLLAGVIAPSPFGLLLGHLIYSGLGIWGLLREVLRNDNAAVKSLSVKKVKGQATLYQRFPRWSVPESLFNSLGIQVPVLMIAAASAGPDAGFLIIALRVMSLPMALVGSSVAQVFVAEAPSKYREGNLRPFALKTILGLLKMGAPPLLIIGALAPVLFPIIFGSDWARSGWLVAWMTPCCILQFLASPVSMALHITQQVKLAMGMQFVGFSIRVIPMILCVTTYPDRLPELYAFTGAIFYGLYLAVIIAILPKATTSSN